MHTSGYLGQHLNTYTSAPNFELNAEELRQYSTAPDRDPFRALHRTALDFILRLDGKTIEGLEKHAPTLRFDPYWQGYLSVDLLEYDIFGNDADVELIIAGQLPNNGESGTTRRLSFNYILSPNSVMIDDEIELFPYEAADLYTDLRVAAAEHFPSTTKTIQSDTLG